MAPAGLGWIGAAIALVTTVTSGIISARQAKKQNAANEEQAAAAIELQDKQNTASEIEFQKMRLAIETMQQQQAAAAAADKEKEKKIIKYGSLIATGIIIFQALKD